MKLALIAEGWVNFLTQPKELQELIKDRLAICDNCPEKVQIGSTGQLILTVLNEGASIYKCGVCKCPLSGKTAAVGSTCPLNRW